MPYTPQTWTNTVATPLSAARLTYMEAGIANAGGGGGGTVYVCASDAIEPIGDYICDGTADEVQVLAAITSIMAIGGTVVLSEGTFNFSSPLVLPTLSGVSVVLIGQGAETYDQSYSTRILMTSGAGPMIDGRTNAGAGVILRNIMFELNSTTANSNIINYRAYGLDVRGCSFSTESTVHHRALEGLNEYTSAYICGNYFAHVSGACIYAYKPYLTVIEDNYLYTPTNGTDAYCVEIIGDTTDGGIFDENFFRFERNVSDGNGTNVGAVHVSGFIGSGLIQGNQFWYDDVSEIFLEDCAGVHVVNNQMGDGDMAGYGIKLDNADSCLIANNLVFYAGQGGIQLVDSSRNLVHGNMIFDCGYTTTNTYNGIFIDGNSDENLVYGNKVGLNPGAAVAAALKWGIRVDDATCNDNMIYGNDVKGSYVTAGVSDAGTGTITTASNRT